MNKELFVSATPHETKVGITEDDQLAEIYLERENEYTLAGSIYKGRVTRVLPGMQSAFVDIGLERDAFLYVSDFMDLEQTDEDLDEPIPANRPANGGQFQRAEAAAAGAEKAPVDAGSATEEDGGPDTGASEPGNTSESSRDSRDFRGRRRRRGRRENGDRGEVRTQSPQNDLPRNELPKNEFPRNDQPRTDSPRNDFSRNDQPRNDSSRTDSSRNDQPRNDQRGGRSGRFDRNSSSRFQRPTTTARTGHDYDYGPPPGYQPIILPGESISKYRQAPTATPADNFAAKPANEPTVAPTFPEDEPIFAAQAAEPLHEQHDPATQIEAYEESTSASVSDGGETVAELRSAYDTPADTPEDRDETAEHILPHEADFAAALGVSEESETETSEVETSEETTESETTKLGASPAVHYDANRVEEQEIEEEEADLTAYGDDLAEDDGFEQIEEESHAPAFAGKGLAASGLAAAAGDETAVEGEPVTVGENGEVSEAAIEAEEREEEELELEEAQAEAEALLEAEAIGDGTVDASAVVRSAPPEARLFQRARRATPNFDRQRGGRRGQRRRFRSRENQVVPQISELLKEGQEILVQIAKEPIGKKGARITSHIALPGRFLVFMPTVNHTGVSRKIASEEERQRLKRIIQSERENGGGGFIVRTAAAGASDEELRADIRFLKNLWAEIKTRAENGKSPALIYHDLNVVERVLRDQVSSDFSVIWVDNELEYERVLRFANRFQPALVRRVKLYTKETPLFEQFGLNEEINKALKSKVWLKSGGYIVINQTEALVAIDVNTGKYVGKTSRLEDTIVKTNVDAIREIVRQIRLRDLGGIIIIDFIDMDERRNRQKVMQALEEALRGDRAPSKVLQFNDFGLVAITRKRVKQSLERTIGSPCPYCQATGFVKAVNTVCNEIYVEMRKITGHLEHSDVMLRVNPEVAKALKATNARLLNEMEELTKKTIIVKSDPALHQEQFDIN